MIKIELCRPKDIQNLIALDKSATTESGRSGQIRDWVAVRQCHMAFREGEPVGFIVYNRAFFHRPFIERVMVAEAFRRQGIGRTLVDHACTVWRREPVWTSTNQSNAPMQALLKGAGFIESGKIDNLDPNDPELVFMRPTQS